MHESILSYNLSRPYPFRWFTWLVFGGGVIATVLFTVINLAADGYNSNTVFLTDINSTLSNKRWFEKQPWSLASKLSTNCQPMILNVGSPIKTNSSIFGYSLSAIYPTNPAEYSEVSEQQYWAYLGNVLDNCTFEGFTLNITNQTGFAPTGVPEFAFEALVNCNVTTAESTTGIELSQTSSDALNAADRQLTNASAPWWAANLVEAYENMITAHLSNKPEAAITLFGSSEVIQLLCSDGEDALNVSCTPIFGTEPLLSTELYTELVNGYTVAISAAIATDFGSMIQPSVLQDLSMFIQFYNKTASLWAQVLLEDCAASDTSQGCSAMDGPSLQSSLGDYDADPPLHNITAFFEYFQSSIPVLEPSVVVGQYLCQVPVLKPAGSLIVSILIADLVLLQALWQLVSLVAISFLERRQPKSQYCLGCAEKISHRDHKPVDAKASAGKVVSDLGESDVKVTSSKVSKDHEAGVKRRGLPEDTQKGGIVVRAITT